MVRFSAGAANAVETAFGEDVDPGFGDADSCGTLMPLPVQPSFGDAPTVALGEPEVEGIGSTLCGWNLCACDLSFPRVISPCGEPVGASGDPSGGGVTLVDGVVSFATGEFAAAGRGVALVAVRGDGVALGTSKRPWRCDAVGETAGGEIAGDVAAAVAAGATDAG